MQLVCTLFRYLEQEVSFWLQGDGVYLAYKEKNLMSKDKVSPGTKTEGGRDRTIEVNVKV